MAKNKNFTAAARKLFLEIKKEIAKEMLKDEVSGPTGNDKQFKGLLMAVKSVILHVEDGDPLFIVGTKKAVTAAALATMNKKTVLEKERRLFVEHVGFLIGNYQRDVKNSSKDSLPIEKATIEAIENLCVSFTKRGLISDTILKNFEAQVSGQVAAA